MWGLPKAGRLLLGSSSIPSPPRSICVGGATGATFASGGSNAAGPERLGPNGGLADRLGILRVRLLDTSGRMGGGTGDATLGDAGNSAGSGERSPAW